MKARIVCKTQPFLDTCQKNADHGKKRENPGFIFLGGQGKLAPFFLLLFWQIFISGEWTIALTGNPTCCTIISRLKSSWQARQVWGNCFSLILQMQKPYTQLKDGLVFRANDLLWEAGKPVTSWFMTLNNLNPLNESKIHILKCHSIFFLTVTFTWKVTMCLTFLITLYVGVYTWL